MSAYVIAECPPHQWAHAPTVGYFMCGKCRERINYDDPRYEKMLKDWTNPAEQPSEVERVARAIHREDIGNYHGPRIGLDAWPEPYRNRIYSMARAAIEAMRAATQAPVREWHPHLDYSGEPMREGEFRDPPALVQDTWTQDEIDAAHKWAEDMAARIRVDGPKPVQDDDAETLLRQLRELAVTLHAKHYPEVTQWQPLDDALGLLSQIDNMTTGLARLATDTALVEALNKCRDKFLHYEQLHRLKCTADGDEKADRNREMADMCDKALASRGGDNGKTA